MTELQIKWHEGYGGLGYYFGPEFTSGSQLPLKQSPINFAVIRLNGLSSDPWLVRVDKKGDIYILCRDNMDHMKVSLHKSGVHQIAFVAESGLEMTEGNRSWQRWSEPDYAEGSKAVPALRLLFPSWGLEVTPETRQEKSPIWDKTQVWIEAAEEPLATEVSFFVTDDTVTNFEVNGVKPCVPVGVLPARPGKTLWAIASHRTEDNLKEWAQDLINQLAADQEIKEKLSDTATGDTLRFNATTYAEDGGACWMRFPATVQWDTAESLPED